MSFNIILLNSADKVANLVGYSKKHIPYVPIPSIKNLDYFSVNISIRSGHVYGMKFCKIQLCHEWNINWQWGMIISWFNKMEFYQRVKQKLADELEAESPLEYPEGKIMLKHHTYVSQIK